MSTATKPLLTARGRAGFAFFFVSFLLFCLATGGNFYQIVAENPNWSGGAREHLEHYQRFFRKTHAGYYFQTVVPTMILTLVAAALLLRKAAGGHSKRLVGILAGAILVEAFTFIYFLPRIFILFLNPLDGVSDAALARAAFEWEAAHVLRMAMVVGIGWLYVRAAWRLCVERIRSTGDTTVPAKRFSEKVAVA